MDEQVPPMVNVSCDEIVERFGCLIASKEFAPGETDWLVSGVPCPGSETDMHDCRIFLSLTDCNRVRRCGVWFEYFGEPFRRRNAADLSLEYVDDPDYGKLVGITATATDESYSLVAELAIIFAGKMREKDFNPEEWWETWIALLGNAERSEAVSSLFAEVLTASLLCEKCPEQISWGGSDMSACDIRAGKDVYEVKSTYSHNSPVISVNNWMQSRLDNYIVVVSLEIKAEASPHTLTLQQVIDKIAEYDDVLLERVRKTLEDMRLDGPLFRQAFLVNSVLLYREDDTWPRLPEMPKGLNVKRYTLDLAEAGINPVEGSDWTEDMIKLYGLPRRD